MRRIQVIGAITDETFGIFSEKLAAFETSNKKVVVELNSFGGEDFAGLAFYGRIKTSPCHIVVKAYGCVMSAASLVLAAGDERHVAPGTWIMLHDSESKVKGNVTDIKGNLRQMETMEHQWAAILAAESNGDVSLWRELSKRTTFLTPDEALSYKLIDHIMKGKTE